MKNKLWYLVKNSLSKKIKSKWFLATNIILAVILVALINIDSIINKFGGEFSESITIQVIDNTNISYDNFKMNMDYASNLLGDDTYNYNIIESNINEEEINEYLENNQDEIFVIFNYFDNVFSSKVISYSDVSSYDYQFISSSINSVKMALTLNKLGISSEEYEKINESATIEKVTLVKAKKTEDDNMNTIMTTVFPVFILPFFILSVLLFQLVGAEVNEEKNNRSMEIIISNVSAKTHFFAKAISGNLFVIFQALLLFLYGCIGFAVRSFIGGSSITNGLGSEVGNIVNSIIDSPIGDKLVYLIPLALILMLLTLLAYSLAAAILASMTVNPEDFQQVQTPIMIISLIGYYLAIMASVFKGAIFIKILSFVPFISAILSPSLLALGDIGVIEMFISIGIMLLFVWVLVRYGLRIYKAGILNYSGTGIWKKVISAAKTRK